MRVQIWSYNYTPEPTGIAPVSATLAHALTACGHSVDVVAAHPHYPEPIWGNRRLPYREVRDGIPVLRLPLWVGRQTAMERYRQELTFMASQFAASPALGKPDIAISASPSFPALLPAIVTNKLRRTPWIAWLHDLLPDGATATGLVDDGLVLNLARRLERAAYKHADRIVVLSSKFTENLVGKDVPEGKIKLIYDPATRAPKTLTEPSEQGKLILLSMGNIGFSQGFTPIVRGIEASDLPGDRFQLRVTGTGMAADEARAEVKTDRVQMLGLVSDDELESELSGSTVGFVTQHYEGTEFNIPSKLMNFMAYGRPVLAAVDPNGEVAKIVRDSGGGWVVNSADPAAVAAQIQHLLDHPEEVRRCAAAARAYAGEHFTVAGFGRQFDALLHEITGRQRPAWQGESLSSPAPARQGA